MSQAKTLQVPVINGMRQDVSERVAPPGTLIEATNVRFNVSGEANSRPGTSGIDVSAVPGIPYSDAVNGNGPDFLTAIPGGFVVGARGSAWRYDFKRGALHVAGSYSNAVPHGRFAMIAGEETKNLMTGEHLHWPCSVAIGGGYVALCWSSGNGQQSIGASGGTGNIKVQIFTEDGTLVTTVVRDDYQTASVLYDPTTGPAGAFIVVAQNVISELWALYLLIGANDVTLQSATFVGTLNAGTCCWATCPWPGVGWALVYQSGALAATIAKLTGPTLLGTATFAVLAGTPPLSIYADASNVYVGWVDVAGANTARARVYSTALALTGGPTDIQLDVSAFIVLTPPLFGPSLTAHAAFCVVGRAIAITGSSAGDTFLTSSVLSSAGALTTHSEAVYGMFPISSPFNSGMVWCRYRTPNGPAAYGNNYVRNVLLDFQADRSTLSDAYWRMRQPVIALAGDPFADPLSGNYRAGIGYLHQCPPRQLSNGHWIAGMPRLLRSEIRGSWAVGLSVAEWLEFATEARRVARHIGSGECFVPGSVALVGLGGGSRNYNPFGGQPSLVEAARGTDLGFLIEPSINAGAESNTADGALTPLGTYYYRRVIEWIDSKGRRHRSRASRAQLVGPLGAANDTVTFTQADDFQWLREARDLSTSPASPSGVVAHYYRTENNGSTFYRCTPPQGAPRASAGSVFVDVISDTQLRTREILYTDGGVLDNDSPPSCRLVSLGEDRLWVAGLWDKRIAQSSKIIVPGEPPQFSDSPAFQLVVPDDITALAAQDGAQVFFCRSAVYGLQGSGPNDQGVGDWGSPRVVTRSTGCINELSVLETGVGIFFQSARGLELLPRGLGEPVFVGEPVTNELEGGVLITNATVVSLNGSTTARFITSGQRVLVYEMKTGAWSIDTYQDDVSVSAICDTDNGAVMALASVVGSQGFMLEQAAYADDMHNVAALTAQIPSTLVWADVRPCGIAGQSRFYDAVLAMDEYSDVAAGGTVKLTVTIDKAVDAGVTFDTAALDGLTYLKHIPAQMSGSGCQLRVDISKAGWRCFGWSVGWEDMGGTRRTGSTEQG